MSDIPFKQKTYRIVETTLRGNYEDEDETVAFWLNSNTRHYIWIEKNSKGGFDIYEENGRRVYFAVEGHHDLNSVSQVVVDYFDLDAEKDDMLLTYIYSFLKRYLS